MDRVGDRVVRGAVAGTVGTVALNASTYLDMVARGRPASSTPERTVERLASLLRVPLPADPDSRKARLSGAGAVLGIVAGVAAGAALGVLRPHVPLRGALATAGTAGTLAMLVGNAPMTLLGVTDPRTWTRTDWAADVVPHAAYGLAAAAAWHRLGGAVESGTDRRRHGTRPRRRT